LKKENPPQILAEVNESSTEKQTHRIFLTDLKLMNEWQCSVIEKKKTRILIICDRKMNRKKEENERCHPIWALCE
jgi:hypothetical protein